MKSIGSAKKRRGTGKRKARTNKTTRRSETDGKTGGETDGKTEGEADCKARGETTKQDGTLTEEDEVVRKIQSRLIDERYLLLPKLGQGGHAQVFLGRDVSDGTEVALKLESIYEEPSILKSEAGLLDYDLKDLEGFPRMYWYGGHDYYRVMVLELLGPNLEDLFAFCDFRFSLETTCMIMDQLLTRLETLHSALFVHRDIKPENCLLGLGTNGNMLYLTDFGICDDIGEDNDNSIYRRWKPHLVGTERYASIRGHEGRAQSGKDDLESLGYMSIRFMRGRLPWQGRAGRKNVLEMKKSISIEELCEGLPNEFAEYMKHVRQLQHGDTPSYAEMRKLFRRCAKIDGSGVNHIYDWTARMYLLQAGSVEADE